jgi:competence protein ComEC
LRNDCPKGHLRINFLDVGQGDSAIIDMPDGRMLLVDGGGAVGNPVDPGRTVIAPILRNRRRKHVDIAVLTHPHPDHFTGLASALTSVSVGEFWDNGQGEKDGAGPLYARLLADLRSRRVPIRRPSELCGTVFHFAQAQLRVLSPCPAIDPSLHGNNNSIILSISMGTKRAMLVGDAEETEESKLLKELRQQDLQADILKVGHHGSRTSSSAPFLDAVRPSWAVLSCGVRNRFGHPHPRTLNELSRRKIFPLRTDLLGGISWETDGERVWMSSAVSGRLSLP